MISASSFIKDGAEFSPGKIWVCRCLVGNCERIITADNRREARRFVRLHMEACHND